MSTATRKPSFKLRAIPATNALSPLRFFGILVLLHACSRSPVLSSLLDSLEQLDDLELSKGYMLRWMRDMQVMHPVARWCWQLLKVIYREHPLVKDLLS
jgi:hypothetical protein